MTPEERRNLLIALAAGAFVILVVIPLMGRRAPHGSEERPAATPRPHSRAGAEIHCKGAIRDRLKAPSTADFPWWATETVEYEPGAYRVWSYVDAQNSYGAQIRTQYLCTIRYRGGNEGAERSWELLALVTDP